MGKRKTFKVDKWDFEKEIRNKMRKEAKEVKSKKNKKAEELAKSQMTIPAESTSDGVTEKNQMLYGMRSGMKTISHTLPLILLKQIRFMLKRQSVRNTRKKKNSQIKDSLLKKYRDKVQNI